MIGIVESKVEGIPHGPKSMGHWVASLLEFSWMIEQKACPGRGQWIII
jgi:hypothetical protein